MTSSQDAAASPTCPTQGCVQSRRTYSSDPPFQLILYFSRMWHVFKRVPESQLPVTIAVGNPWPQEPAHVVGST